MAKTLKDYSEQALKAEMTRRHNAEKAQKDAEAAQRMQGNIVKAGEILYVSLGTSNAHEVEDYRSPPFAVKVPMDVLVVDGHLSEGYGYHGMSDAYQTTIDQMQEGYRVLAHYLERWYQVECLHDYVFARASEGAFLSAVEDTVDRLEELLTEVSDGFSYLRKIKQPDLDAEAERMWSVHRGDVAREVGVEL